MLQWQQCHGSKYSIQGFNLILKKTMQAQLTQLFLAMVKITLEITIQLFYTLHQWGFRFRQRFSRLLLSLHCFCMRTYISCSTVYLLILLLTCKSRFCIIVIKEAIILHILLLLMVRLYKQVVESSDLCHFWYICQNFIR